MKHLRESSDGRTARRAVRGVEGVPVRQGRGSKTAGHGPHLHLRSRVRPGRRSR
nr:MAG TPA: hypothetical protein [Caudoviricetes sp.]